MGLENGDDSVIPPQDLLERFKDYGQEQTLAYWHDLTPEERDVLIQDLESVDLPRVSRIVRKSLRKQDKPNCQPILDSEVATLDTRTQDERGRWWGMGLRAISEGKLAVLLLSGGQGTRLGSKDPKGCFNIGLPSGKSLFQLQAERILRVQKLASQSTTNGKVVKVPWYIMTSPFTDSATKKFFQNRKYFGLEQDQVMFFQQGTLPCISKDGRFIMSNPYKMAMAPDGNGGVYAALKSSRCLEDMARRGIKYVDVYSVDNTLVRVADPLFLGYWIDQGTSCAAKVIKKAYPQERVGVFVHHGKGGPVGVAEYTELGADLQFAINQETGRLAYKWSNVCMHMFSLDFLHTVVEELEKDSIYHLAEKKIQSVDGVIDGIKLEQFIFDSIPYAPSISLFEVIREEEFAPVKNASGATTDSPDTARALLQRLHMGWVVSAGGSIANTGTAYASGVEVSPLLSYAGEGLEDLCRGRTFHASTEIHA
ncbi:UDP-N-acetylglucosamine/UDP-N-acetylgalactosamine diphosphorylase [Marchantia polymorpha subsp. ruderalis]|nr:hypothetical protein MARPO_0089s0037 [Marchantia polymorpha]|eukprot:PTQ33406.1 hypothetical protein MARPO_0089s0037 [Marchantia polymorpha]